eukprot:m.488715 g.488715  ORF g.488715 m.488715 type:complete len:464 (-) comp26036_c0_seq1:226-1617(-)
MDGVEQLDAGAAGPDAERTAEHNGRAPRVPKVRRRPARTGPAGITTALPTSQPGSATTDSLHSPATGNASVTRTALGDRVSSGPDDDGSDHTQRSHTEPHSLRSLAPPSSLPGANWSFRSAEAPQLAWEGTVLVDPADVLDRPLLPSVPGTPAMRPGRAVSPQGSATLTPLGRTLGRQEDVDQPDVVQHSAATGTATDRAIGGPTLVRPQQTQAWAVQQSTPNHHAHDQSMTHHRHPEHVFVEDDRRFRRVNKRRLQDHERQVHSRVIASMADPLVATRAGEARFAWTFKALLPLEAMPALLLGFAIAQVVVQEKMDTGGDVGFVTSYSTVALALAAALYILLGLSVCYAGNQLEDQLRLSGRGQFTWPLSAMLAFGLAVIIHVALADTDARFEYHGHDPSAWDHFGPLGRYRTVSMVRFVAIVMGVVFVQVHRVSLNNGRVVSNAVQPMSPGSSPPAVASSA